MENALKNDKLTWRNELKLPNDYQKQSFYKNLSDFANKYYYRWLYELSTEKHDRKFLPFDLSIITNKGELAKDSDGTLPTKVVIDEKKLFTLVTGMPANKKSISLLKDRIKYDEVFSKMAKDIVSLQLSNKEQMVNTLLNRGISKIVDKRYTL